MKKTTKRAVALLLMAVVVLLTFTGCSKGEKEVKILMEDFQIACNNLDFNMVLDCIDPKVSDKVRIAAGVVGMFTGTQTDEMFDALSGLITDSEISGTDFFSTIEINIDEIEVEEEKATVKATVYFEMNGETFSHLATFKCIYYSERWYISNFILN